jgi:hypothetical protein
MALFLRANVTRNKQTYINEQKPVDFKAGRDPSRSHSW